MGEYEPTKEELKNGWTAESIRQYVEERDGALNRPSERVLPTRQVRKHPFKR